jgi:hypothetical protein
MMSVRIEATNVTKVRLLESYHIHKKNTSRISGGVNMTPNSPNSVCRTSLEQRPTRMSDKGIQWWCLTQNWNDTDTMLSVGRKVVNSTVWQDKRCLSFRSDVMSDVLAIGVRIFGPSMTIRMCHIAIPSSKLPLDDFDWNDFLGHKFSWWTTLTSLWTDKQPICLDWGYLWLMWPKWTAFTPVRHLIWNDLFVIEYCETVFTCCSQRGCEMS